MDYRKKFVVEPGSKVRLDRLDPSYTGKHTSEDEARATIERDCARLTDLQYRLYAEHARSVLIVLQALDAGGKDGTVRHVFGALNPQGASVHAFKEPTPEELAHDFLWRVHKVTPAHGEIAIFNRSHYEDVLVVRVHDLVPKDVWSKRYDRIVEFEKNLAQGSTHVLKFFLHISKEEQLRRLRARLDDPHKHWKVARVGLRRAHVLGRVPAGVRGCARALQHRARAVVRHPGGPQVVPQPRRRADRRRHARRPGHEVPEAEPPTSTRSAASSASQNVAGVNSDSTSRSPRCSNEPLWFIQSGRGAPSKKWSKNSSRCTVQ